MAEDSENGTSRNEVIFAVVLFIVGIGALTATMLNYRGLWFDQTTALIIYRILWVFAWLPGMAMALVLLLRRKSIISMALAILLQAAALVIYEISPQMVNLAGALGFLGLGMPWLLSLHRCSKKDKYTLLIAYLGLPLFVFFIRDNWIWAFAIICLFFIWLHYAVSISPEAGRALDRIHEQEEQQRKELKTHVWLERVVKALWILIALIFIAAFLMFAYFWLSSR